MSTQTTEGMGDNVLKYTCRACKHSFKRVTNVAQPLELPCSNCADGIMDVEEA